MSANSNTPGDDLQRSQQNISHLMSGYQVKITFALLLIASGIAFFLAQGKIIDWGSPWWVIYIGIPGLALLWAAYETYRHVGAVNGLARTQLALGIVALVLSFIFIVDPHWSFTKNLFNWPDVPFLRTIDWNHLWPWLLVVLGAALIYTGVRRHVAGTAVFGGILVVVGGVFILNISWDTVWPLAIVAAGVGLLLSGWGRR